MSVHPAGFETAVPASDVPQILAFDRSATWTVMGVITGSDCCIQDGTSYSRFTLSNSLLFNVIKQ